MTGFVHRPGQRRDTGRDHDDLAAIRPVAAAEPSPPRASVHLRERGRAPDLRRGRSRCCSWVIRSPAPSAWVWRNMRRGAACRSSMQARRAARCHGDGDPRPLLQPGPRCTVRRGRQPLVALRDVAELGSTPTTLTSWSTWPEARPSTRRWRRVTEPDTVRLCASRREPDPAGCRRVGLQGGRGRALDDAVLIEWHVPFGDGVARGRPDASPDRQRDDAVRGAPTGPRTGRREGVCV
jgi:hypothetical protein